MPTIFLLLIILPIIGIVAYLAWRTRRSAGRRDALVQAVRGKQSRKR